MCILHTKRANIWHPMKPDLHVCCDASDGDCYIVNLFDYRMLIKDSIVIDRYHWAYVTSDGETK